MDGTSLSLRYDAQGNLRQYGDVVREVDYTVEGQLERMAFGNGLEQRMAYDQRLRPIRYTLGRPDANPLLDLEQRVDAAGIPTSLQDHVTPTGTLSQSAIFTVDGLYRLTGLEAPALGGEVSYTYDAGNSLVSRILDGTPLPGADVADLSNGLFELGGTGANGETVGPHQVSRVGDRRLGYDDSGRLVEDQRPEGTQLLSWDPAGRLRAVSRPDGTVVQYRYNGATDRQLRRVRNAEGAVVEEAVFFDERHELRTTPERGTELLKIVNVGGERVAEIRVPGDPGVTAANFDAPSVAPWAGALGAAPIVTSPPGSGRGHPGNPGSGPAVLMAERTRRALQRARGSLRTIDHLWPLLPLGGGAVLVLIALGGPVPRRRRLVFGRLTLATGTVVLLGTSASVLLSCADDDDSSSPEHSSSDVSANGEIFYLHAPRMGTVTLRTNAHGQVVMRAHRTPFGVETAVEHEGDAPTESWFTGKEVDSTTGYVFFGARWYDPSLGRFISPDPLPLWDAGVSWGDANPMAYVGNRPTFMVDPTGLSGVALYTFVANRIDDSTGQTQFDLIGSEIRSLSDEQLVDYVLRVGAGGSHRQSFSEVSREAKPSPMDSCDACFVAWQVSQAAHDVATFGPSTAATLMFDAFVDLSESLSSGIRGARTAGVQAGVSAAAAGETNYPSVDAPFGIGAMVSEETQVNEFNRASEMAFERFSNFSEQVRTLPTSQAAAQDLMGRVHAIAEFGRRFGDLQDSPQ